MKKTIHMILFATALAAVNLLSCNSPDLVPEAPFTLEYSIIEGDTIKNRNDKNIGLVKEKDKYRKQLITFGDTVITYKKPKFEKPKDKVDLSKLKNENDPSLKGKPFKYIAVGGSFAAGVRDGGYFNEGAETSYPNIIANQMNIPDFKVPYFSPSDYNGYGRRAQSDYNPTGGPVPKFKDVINNGGVEYVDETGITLKKKTGQWDNMAFMNMNAAELLNGSDIFASENGSEPEDKLDAQLYRRVFRKESKENLNSMVLNGKYDFISFDFGGLFRSNHVFLQSLKFEFNQDDIIFSENELIPGSVEDFRAMMEVKVLKGFDKIHGQTNGIIFNYPNFYLAPYFNYINDEKIKFALGGQRIYVEQYGSYESFKYNYQLLPTSEVDSMLSPNVNIALKKGVSPDRPLSFRSIISHPEKGLDSFLMYNKMIASLGKRYNLPVVDLYSLFERVNKSEYVTHDGIKADPSWLSGNFYSSDGIFPSAFGQAIIANEAIRTINTYYKTNIPLANTRPFLEIK